MHARATSPPISSAGSPRLRLGELLSVRPTGVHQHAAVQDILGRPVVVLSQPDPGLAAELRAEARLMARLAHPNILPVHAIIDEGEGVQVVLASVPGDTWERRLSQPHLVRSVFGAEDVLAWHVQVLIGIGSALSHAHGQGVLHGDLRPETIWIGDLGEVYLADWSAARFLGSQPDEDAATTTDLDESAMAYMSPERVFPALGGMDERSDVYQLGGLLFRILTGAGPHGEDIGSHTLKQVLFRDPVFPDSAPPSLARVCKRALARNPAARYPSAAAFCEALLDGFAQRGAWQIAAKADAQFDRLQQHLRAEPQDPAAIYRSYAAVRLGYAQAIAEAPTLESARLRLDRALEGIVGHLIASGELTAAEAVLGHAERQPAHLIRELEQAEAQEEPAPAFIEDRATQLGRALDPHRDGGRRTWIATVLALVWVPSPLTALIVDPAWIAPAVLFGAAALTLFGIVLARISAADRAHSRLTRDLVNWTLWGAISIGFLAAIAAFSGLPPGGILAICSVGTFLVVGASSVSLDGRLAIPALGYGAVAALTLAEPSAWAIGTFIANGVLTTTLITDGKGGSRDR